MVFDLNHVIEQIHKEKGISKEALIEAIEQAMLSAARKKLGFGGDLEAQFNPEFGEVELFQFKTVVDDVFDDEIDIDLKRAKELDPDAELGDSIGEKIDSTILGRIAAQTAKQVIIQKMREAEKEMVVGEYEDKLGQVLGGIVRRYEKNDLIIDLNKTEAIIRKREQVEGENYKPGDRIQALLYEIDIKTRGPMLQLSRRHPQLVKTLFETEVPEIAEGIVEIKSVARDGGVRSKIAVYSTDADVDPVGACVGLKGSRVQSVVQELRGEKIDIVLWDPDPARFVCNAIAPAQVSQVIILERKNSMEIVVPDDQLSLAIGRKGQNVRLAANLTGWNIDVYSESKVDEMARFSKQQLVEALGISESLATLLYGHAFRSIDEIAEAPEDEFMSIPGMETETLANIYQKAKELVEQGYLGTLEQSAEEESVNPETEEPAQEEAVEVQATEEDDTNNEEPSEQSAPVADADSNEVKTL